MTRLYFGATGAVAPATNPSAVDALWTVVPSVSWRKLHAQKQAFNSATTVTSAETSTTSPTQLFTRGFVLEGLPAQTISGTFSMVLRVSESSGLLNGSLQVVIKVFDSLGTTLRGTLYAGHAAANNATVGALGEEMGTSTSTRIIPSGTALTSVVCSAGDMLVVEVGARCENVSATSYSTTLAFGHSLTSADLALTSGLTTTSTSPWIEFSSLVYPQTSKTWGIAGADAVLDWKFNTSADTGLWSGTNSTPAMAYDNTTAPAGHGGSVKITPTAAATWRVGMDPLNYGVSTVDMPMYADLNASTDYAVSFWAKASETLTARADAYFTGYAKLTQIPSASLTLTTTWTKYTFPTMVDVYTDGGNLNGVSLVELYAASGATILPANVWVSGLRIERTPTDYGVGSLSIQQIVVPTGIGSAEALGSPTTTPGSTTVVPTGIAGLDNELDASDRWNFNTGTGAWAASQSTLAQITSGSPEGAGYLEITGTGANAQATRDTGINNTITAGTKRFRIRVKSSVATDVKVDVYLGPSYEQTVTQTFSVTTSWADYAIDFTTIYTKIVGVYVYMWPQDGTNIGKVVSIDDNRLGAVDVGSPSATLTYRSVDGITATDTIGTPTVTLIKRQLDGIASAESVGQPTVMPFQYPVLIGIPVDSLVGSPTISYTVKLASAPSVETEQRGTTGLHKFYTVTEGTTWWKIGGVWQSGSNQPDQIAGATETFRGGYEYEVDTTKAAELQALGFTIRTELR